MVRISISQKGQDDKLIFCNARKDDLSFMLNQRRGSPVKPEDYEGIRLYLGAEGSTQTRERLKSLGLRCFRTRISRLQADRVFLTRRRRLFALLRPPYTKIDISRNRVDCESRRLQTAQWNGASHCRKSRPPIRAAYPQSKLLPGSRNSSVWIVEGSPSSASNLATSQNRTSGSTGGLRGITRNGLTA